MCKYISLAWSQNTLYFTVYSLITKTKKIIFLLVKKSEIADETTN